MERAFESTEERVLYRKGNDVVTQTQIRVRGQTLDPAAISTVSLVDPVLKPGYGYAAIALGIVLAVVGYLVWQPYFLTPILGGLALIVVGLVLIGMVNYNHTVRIHHTDGNTTMMQFRNRADAANFVTALSETVAHMR